MRHAASACSIVATVALVAGACADAPLGPVDARLELAPAALVFPTTFIGGESRLELHIANAGRSPGWVRLSTTEPFTLSDTALELAAVETLVVSVRFAPHVAGSFRAELLAETSEGGRTIDLTGTAEEPLRCRADACRIAEFNPTTGACEDRPAADGSACVEACLEDPRCAAGRCIGTARDCSDGNPCTRDLCDSAAGCAHLEDAAHCPPPSDPCRAAFCDPQLGCASGPVPDGTTCGAGDCTSLSLCVSGACGVVPTPEETPCARATPCREEGKCRSQTCVPGAEKPLRERWSYSVAGDWAISFPGIVDGDGNSYWVEREATTHQVDLVSMTAEGVLRYRTAIAVAGSGYFFRSAGMSLSGDLVLLAVVGNFVEARSQLDGTLVWRRDIVELVTGGVRSSSEAAPPSLNIASLLRADADSFYLVVGGNPLYWNCPQTAICEGFILRLSVREGHVLWSRSSQLHLFSAIADAQGHLYYLEYWGQWLVSLGLDGVERWRRRDQRFGQLRMVHRDRLLLDVSGTSTLDDDLEPIMAACKTLVVDATSGDEVFTFPTIPGTYWHSPSPVGSDGFFIAATGTAERLHCPADNTNLLAFDASGNRLWERRLAMSGDVAMSQPVLSSDGYLVAIADRAAGATARLVKYSRAGDELVSCAFPPGTRPLAEVAVASGHWLAIEIGERVPRTLRAWDVAADAPASSGWTTAGADMLKSGQDRE